MDSGAQGAASPSRIHHLRRRLWEPSQKRRALINHIDEHFGSIRKTVGG